MKKRDIDNMAVLHIYLLFIVAVVYGTLPQSLFEQWVWALGALALYALAAGIGSVIYFIKRKCEVCGLPRFVYLDKNDIYKPKRLPRFNESCVHCGHKYPKDT